MIKNYLIVIASILAVIIVMIPIAYFMQWVMPNSPTLAGGIVGLLLFIVGIPIILFVTNKLNK